MNEELQQQLMEFVYGLLEDDEANAALRADYVRSGSGPCLLES